MKAGEAESRGKTHNLAAMRYALNEISCDRILGPGFSCLSFLSRYANSVKASDQAGFLPLRAHLPVTPACHNKDTGHKKSM